MDFQGPIGGFLEWQKEWQENLEKGKINGTRNPKKWRGELVTNWGNLKGHYHATVLQTRETSLQQMEIPKFPNPGLVTWNLSMTSVKSAVRTFPEVPEGFLWMNQSMIPQEKRRTVDEMRQAYENEPRRKKSKDCKGR